jgi:hypothetical protein
VTVDTFVVRDVVASGSRWVSATKQESLESHLLRPTHIGCALRPTEISVVENAEDVLRIATSEKLKMFVKRRYSLEF